MFLIGLLTGCYITVSLFTFLYVTSNCILAGRGTDLLWRPFIYGLLWPIFLLLFFLLKGKK
jgi:hypothetical protein